MPGFPGPTPPAGGTTIAAASPTLWPLVELRGTLMGPTTPYRIGPPGITGLGVAVKSADTDLAHDHGDWAAEDYEGPLTIGVPLILGTQGAATAVSAMTDYFVMRDVWMPSPTDLELHLQLPGIGHFYVVGRPRGLGDDFVRLKHGLVAALATFKANEPTITEVA